MQFKKMAAMAGSALMAGLAIATPVLGATVSSVSSISDMVSPDSFPMFVVGADAECVIVANQKGDKSQNKTYKFEYVEGALEHSFKISNEGKILYYDLWFNFRQGIYKSIPVNDHSWAKNI